MNLRAGFSKVVGTLLLTVAPVPATGETLREAMIAAVFTERDHTNALARIDEVLQSASAVLARAPKDEEAAMVHAAATGYRAKLTRDRSGAVEARRKFEALVVTYPANPEAHLALGGWHLGAIATAGRFLARVAVGAQPAIGYAEVDRALQLGRDHAAYPALAALMRLELDADDSRAIQLTEAATRAPTSTQLDRIMQRAATAVLVPLRKGDRKAAQALAKRLLPLGRFAAK